MKKPTILILIALILAGAVGAQQLSVCGQRQLTCQEDCALFGEPWAICGGVRMVCSACCDIAARRCRDSCLADPNNPGEFLCLEFQQIEIEP